jgi:hypothetical protein
MNPVMLAVDGRKRVGQISCANEDVSPIENPSRVGIRSVAQNPKTWQCDDRENRFGQVIRKPLRKLFNWLIQNTNS